MKNFLYALCTVFFCTGLFCAPAFAQQFENTFGSLVNHEEPQDGKPIPNGQYIVLSNTLSYGPASRILLTSLTAAGSVGLNVTIHDPASPATGYFGTAIDLDYSAAGLHTGYFIAGSRTTATGRQAILLRTNTSGTVSWVKVLPNNDGGGNLVETGVSVERQSNGDVILTGSGYNAVANNHRFFVVRFNSAGVQGWSYRYYATATGQSFEATEACNAIRSGVAVIVVTGRYWVAGSANSHTFLSCIDAGSGVEIWRRSYDSGSFRDAGIDVVYKAANGNEAAALMVVGWAGQTGTALWVIRANPLNGIASSKTYLPNVSSSAFSANAVSLDVTGTRAAITGLISYSPLPGTLFSGTFAMVLPFYGTELPSWTYYYSSSSPLSPAPRSISRITGATSGYLVTCGTRLTGSNFNDAHAIRVNSLGLNGQGCPIRPVTVVRNLVGTSAWRDFTKISYTWTNINLTRLSQPYTQEFCTAPPTADITEDRTNDWAATNTDEPQIFPNPATRAQVATLAFNLPASERVQVRIIDLAGREVWSFRETLAEGQQALELPVGQWANGAYFVQLQSPTWSKTLKFVVSVN